MERRGLPTRGKDSRQRRRKANEGQKTRGWRSAGRRRIGLSDVQVVLLVDVCRLQGQTREGTPATSNARDLAQTCLSAVVWLTLSIQAGTLLHLSTKSCQRVPRNRASHLAVLPCSLHQPASTWPGPATRHRHPTSTGTRFCFVPGPPIVMASDLDQLVAMGFDKERAELSVKQTGGCRCKGRRVSAPCANRACTQCKGRWTGSTKTKTSPWTRSGANATPLQPMQPMPNHRPCSPARKREAWPATTAESASAPSPKLSFTRVNRESPISHAECVALTPASGHENFSESTEEIKPLTEEEKQQRLDEMRAKLADKRKLQVDQDKVDRKKNEQIRMKATKESQDIKEDLQKKERLKEAMAKKREKQDEADARKRVLAKLEEDKAQRRRKAEAEKAARAGQAPPPPAEPSQPSTAGPTTSKPASAYAEARLALQTPTGRATKTYPAETTLFEVAQALEQDGVAVSNFTQNFPKKIFSQAEFSMTLREAGMVPSAALIVK